MLLALPLVAIGCIYDTRGGPAEVDAGDTDTGTPDAGPDAGGDTGDVAGSVTIATGLDASAYVVADLYVAFLEACPSMTVQNPAVFFQQVEESLDYSTPGATHAYAAHGVPAGTSYAWAFLDVNGDVAAAEPAPDTGDAIATTCFEVILETGGIVQNADVSLSMIMP
jgi:hypothetical protein